MLLARPEAGEWDTSVGVTLRGDGVEAHTTASMLEGAGGWVDHDQFLGLGAHMRALGSASPWAGDRTWRSSGEQLTVRARCDALGHVTLRWGLASLGTFDADRWVAAAEVTVALGDLLRLADDVDAWFARE